MPSLIRIAQTKNLVDQPSSRKIHLRPIPSLGGIAIFAGFALSLCLFWPEKGALVDFQSIICASLIIFLLGLKDDLVGISPKSKFAGQILACAVVIFKQELIIKSFYGLFALGEISGLPAIALTFLTAVLIINAYNLIDGIDGLASSLGILSLSVFGYFFYNTGHTEFAIVASALVGSILGFAVYNRHPASIFMGDTGSLLIGLLNAIFALKFMLVMREVPANEILNLGTCPVVAIAIIFVPLFDAVRVFAVRILKGKSPFAPEKNHVHHMLLKLGFGHNAITALLFTSNLIIILLAWNFNFIDPTLLFLSFVLIGSITLISLYTKVIKRIESASSAEVLIPPTTLAPRIQNQR